LKVLICDDDLTSRKILESILPIWEYEPVSTENGMEALEKMQEPDAPKIAIIDRIMPGMDGVEVCRKLRLMDVEIPHYVILLTVLGSKKEIVEGLEAGADDYISKPFDSEELRARLNVGKRIVELQETLSQRMKELQETINQNKSLRGLLPMCSHCHKIRDKFDQWHPLDVYVTEHSEARVSHGICPDCKSKYYGELFEDK